MLMMVNEGSIIRSRAAILQFLQRHEGNPKRFGLWTMGSPTMLYVTLDEICCQSNKLRFNLYEPTGDYICDFEITINNISAICEFNNHGNFQVGSTLAGYWHRLTAQGAAFAC